MGSDKSNHSPSESHSPPPSEPNATKPKHLDLPTTTPITSGASRTTPSQLLPAPALFHGPHSRNASNLSLTQRSRDRDDKPTGTGTGTGTPAAEPDQHLPRARPPTSSFSGGSRPSLIADHALPRSSYKKPPNSLGAGNAIRSTQQQRHDDEFRADAVWAEMQKTLADVELSAMNSSHVFSQEHVAALEDLRVAQLGLARAWAREEAEEQADEEFGRDVEGGAAGDNNAEVKGGMFSRGQEAAGAAGSPKSERGRHSRSRRESSVSVMGETLEEETERDIKLGRTRREANDRYFKQVNSGVGDVVKRLDEVVEAMRRVEKESREIWNSSESGGGSGDDSEDLGVHTETDESLRPKTDGDGGRKRAGTADTGTATTESDVFSDSPGTVATKEK